MPRYLVDLKPRKNNREPLFQVVNEAPVAEKAPEPQASPQPAALESAPLAAAASPIVLQEEAAPPNRKRILIAGASGAIGYPLLDLAKKSGYWVRTLSKSRWRAPKVSLLADELWLRDALDREAIRGICQGADIVVSCLGGSLDPTAQEKRGFSHLDFEANLHLLEEAVQAKVRRFVYVSVYGAKHSENTAFVRAHRRFENALRDSGLEYTILRFTGLHATPDSLFSAARERALPFLGNNDSRTNPIHPEDAAKICLDHIDSGPEIVEAGGPDILTRRELTEMVYGYAGTTPKFYRTPAFLRRLFTALARPFNPRKANLSEFRFRASRADIIAPSLGTRPFAEYLLEHQGNPNLAQESA